MNFLESANEIELDYIPEAPCSIYTRNKTTLNINHNSNSCHEVVVMVEGDTFDIFTLYSDAELASFIKEQETLGYIKQ